MQSFLNWSHRVFSEARALLLQSPSSAALQALPRLHQKICSTQCPWAAGGWPALPCASSRAAGNFRSTPRAPPAQTLVPVQLFISYFLIQPQLLLCRIFAPHLKHTITDVQATSHVWQATDPFLTWLKLALHWNGAASGLHRVSPAVLPLLKPCHISWM